MLKALIFAGALATLLPAAALAQPQPYYGQDDPGYSRGDAYPRPPRYPDRWYGYEGVPLVRGHPAYDQYGPDPNGLRAPDGHRLKCKLQTQWDAYLGQYVRRRACW